MPEVYDWSKINLQTLNLHRIIDGFYLFIFHKVV